MQQRWALWRSMRLCCGMALVICSLVLPLHAQDEGTILTEGFEGTIPDLHTYQATCAADTTRAHTGDTSLRVTPDVRGGAYFRLDGIIDRTSDCEFSAWVNAGADGAVELYISATDGERRFTLGSASGGTAGEWVKLTGTVRAEDWQDAKSDVMLAMVSRGESSFDDVRIARTVLPAPPIEIWPDVERLLHSQSGARVTTIERGAPVELNATHAAFAADLAVPEVALPDTESVRLPPDGVLTFALDVPEPVYVTGSISFKPDADLRPGLRAYVLSDSTLVAAPMVAAPEWGPISVREAIPDIEGAEAPERVELAEWLLPAGRHCIKVVGPFFRSGGEFRGLELTPTGHRVREPAYEFALLSDTHVAKGRWPYTNMIMGGPAADALPVELEALRAEGVDFALIAGDMVNGSKHSEYKQLAAILDATDLPVFGCVGNHDAYVASARDELLTLVPGLFPGGELDYVVEREPLRFIVIDASHWRTRDGEVIDHYDQDDYGGIGLAAGQLEWLRDTLAADTQTPTVAVWHYGFYDRRGASSCGYALRSSTCRSAPEVLEILSEAPNVIATLSGHSHYNQVNRLEGITHIQNPAFAEWPNAYRVFRVYGDHMEWELRLVRNLGMVREAFTPEKAQSWMISTGPGDLVGEIALSR